MRTVIITAAVVVAGVASAQDGKNAAIKAVADVTAAAPYCGFEVNRDAIEKYLTERGVSRSRPADAEALERAFYQAGSGWRVTGSVYGKGKPQFDAPCQQAESAFGPQGTIRSGLIRLK
ncbi:hypothetical protein ASE63_22440 [Bosea sp. Root381]|uniref:hypothetical protein n=1 Tax=Bosea sp. Root381 TaxID=1736524 RepID=UPI0006F723F9|nr:hypothetical protein [Bosea sp. Root381]KRE07461.1 hypothetical protein ASE63_22440 [Bosea sp. Root381]